MAETQEQLGLERKVDKLQLQMDFQTKAVEEIQKGQKETNAKLDALRDGYISRAEFKEAQLVLRDLATKEEIKGITKEVEELKEDKKWLVRLVLGVVILAVLGLVIITK